MAVRKDKDRDTCTACAGTMLLEMAALSRFTGRKQRFVLTV